MRRRPGDTILLTAGATYIGNFVLPVKSGSEYITIMTAAAAGQPATSTRVLPSHAALLAKIRSNNSAAAVRYGAWRTPLAAAAARVPSTFEGYGDISRSVTARTTRAQWRRSPRHRARSSVHSRRPRAMGQKRGVALNAADVRIRNCYISDIKAVG